MHEIDEDFDNFMARVNEVEKIVNSLSSTAIHEKNELTEDNKIFKNKSNDKAIKSENLRIKSSRTAINKCPTNDSIPKEAFMKTVQQDAERRSDERKVRNERADHFKTIGNEAFNAGNYEKAITYYEKAIEQRKDSAIIWNNRALSYIKLGLYEKALEDCEWALKVDNSNIKALLNSAKCHNYLNQSIERDKFIQLARNRVPKFIQYIKDFEQELKKNHCNE